MAWLSFHVCLQKHIPVEGEREKGNNSGAAIVVSPSALSQSGVMEHVNTELLFTSFFTCFSPPEMQNVHSSLNKYVSN